MSDIYNERILALSKDQTLTGAFEEPDHEATLTNPLCGDRVHIQFCCAEDQITAVRYRTRGCLLCKAASALFAFSAPGMDRNDLLRLQQSLEASLKAPQGQDIPFPAGHEIFAVLRSHRNRHGCVLLPYFAALEAWRACR